MKNRVRVFRAEFDFSQSDLAREAGLSRQTISNIETGTKEPTLETAAKIARVFKTAIEEVFPGIKEILKQ